MTLFDRSGFGVEKPTARNLFALLSRTWCGGRVGQNAGAPPDAGSGDSLILVGRDHGGLWCPGPRALQRHSPDCGGGDRVSCPDHSLTIFLRWRPMRPDFAPDLSPVGWAAMAYPGNSGLAVISYYALALGRSALQTPTLVAVALPIETR